MAVGEESVNDVEVGDVADVGGVNLAGGIAGSDRVGEHDTSGIALPTGECR